MWHDTNRDPRKETFYPEVDAAFDREALARVCAMDEEEFGDYYDMKRVDVQQMAPADFYFHKDNGSNILAVAHLDTVMPADGRGANFVDTEAGPVVFSGALDDRLGAYIILELLPQLGVTYDWLLTVGEESGQSTADFFLPEKSYNWMIEFDRGGTDVVMYQYEDEDSRRRVRAAGAVVGDGIFSDISYMEHLGIKGFNWGVGYRDYHGPRSHAYLDDTMLMVAKFCNFHLDNEDECLYHDQAQSTWWGRGLYGGSGGWSSGYSNLSAGTKYSGKYGGTWPNDVEEEVEDAAIVPDRRCDQIFGSHNHDDDDCAEILKEFALDEPCSFDKEYDDDPEVLALEGAQRDRFEACVDIIGRDDALADAQAWNPNTWPVMASQARPLEPRLGDLTVDEFGDALDHEQVLGGKEIVGPIQGQKLA
jgi:hypothetical protein